MRYSKIIPSLKTILFVLLISSANNLLKAQDCTVNAGIPETICDNEAMLLKGNSTGLFTVNASWSQVSGPSVSISNPSDLNSNVNGYVGGEAYTFRISATCQDGVSVYDEVIITVNPISTALAGTDQESCPGTLTLDANTVGTNETGLWTIRSNGGGISVQTPASPISQITLPTTSGGVSTLRWTISNSNGCNSFDEVNITNYGGVSPVYAGSDQNLSNCYTAFQSTSLSGSFGGSGYGGQSGVWTMVSGPNYATISSPNSSNTGIGNLIEGVYVFRWEVSGPCVNGSDEVTITVPKATQDVSNAAASDLRFCYGATTAVLEGSVPQFANEDGFWTQVSGPAVTITSPTTATTSITGLDGSSTYRFNYTITNNQTGCSDADNGVYIRFADAPTINVGADQVLSCGDNSTIVSPIVTGGTTTRYKTISGPVTTNWIYNSNANVTISNLDNGGTYTVLFERYATGTGCASAYDELNINVSETPTLSNAGTDQRLACNVVKTDLAGNKPDFGVGTWSQVSGPNIANISNFNDESSPIDGLAEGAYVFRWVISGGNNCPVEQDEVEVIVSKTTASSAAGDARIVCHSSTVILAGNTPQSNETGVWTVSPSAGISFANASDPSTAVTGMLASTPYTFTWTVTNGCGSVPSDVIITTNNIAGPSYADAGNDQCETTTPITLDMNGNDPSVGIGQWTVLDGPNSPSIVNQTLFNTQISGMIEGHYQIEWSINVPGCTSTRDTLIASILTTTTDSNADTDKSVCGSSVVMTANIPNAYETGRWEQVSGNSGFTISNVSAHDATFSDLVPGRYEFAWIIEKGICPASTDTLVITVSEQPDVSVTTSNYAVCSGTTATLAANNPNVGTGIWTLNGSSTNRPTITSITSPTTTVTGLATGEYTFRWTITSGADCAPEINDLIIQVSAPAVATPDQQLCNATEAFLEGTDGTDGVWSVAPANGGNPIPSISNTSVHTAMVTGMGLDEVYTFRYTVPAIYSCPSTFDDLTVSTSPYGTDPDAGADQEVCLSFGNSITMAANNPGTGVGSWSQVSGPNTATFVDNASNISDVNGLIAGVYIFEWNVDYGYCGTYKDVMRLNVYDEPSNALAGTDQLNACQFDAQLQGNLPAVGIGIWTLISAPSANAASTVVIDNPNLPGSTLSNINEIGTYTLQWTITNGSVCAAKTDQVNIVFTANPPTTPDADIDRDLCDVTSITMTGNNPATGTGTWSQITGPGGATILNPNNFNTDVNGMIPGTYEFQWQIVSGGCTLSDNMIVVNSATPPVADASATDPEICQFDSPILIGNEANPGTGTWTSISGPTSPVIANPNNSMTNVTGTTTGTYRFRWTITNGACPATFNEVDVTIVNNPLTNLTVSGNTVCEGTDGELTINSTENNITYEAFILGSSVDTILGDGTNLNLTVLAANLSLNDNYVDFKATNTTNCTVNLDNQATITVIQNPDAADAGINQEVCMTGTTLNGNNPGTGNGIWSTTGSANFTDASLYNTDVANLDVGINTFTWKIANTAFCPESSDDMVITNYQIPTVANAGTPQDICGNSTTLAGNNPTVGTGAWSTSGSGIFSNSSAYNSDVSNLAYAANTLTWTISNGVCTPSASQVIVTAKQEPDKTLDITGNTVCENSDGTITVVLSENSIDYEIFSGATSLGTILGVGTDIDFSVLAANLNVGANTFSVVAMHTITSCVVNMDNQPTVTVNANPLVGINVSGNTVCDETDGALSILVSENNITYEAFIATNSVGTAVGNGNDIQIVVSINDLEIGDNTLNIVATSLADCFNPLTNNAIITVNANPIQDLSIAGGEICNGDTGIITISSSENDIKYELFIEQNSVATAIGTGNNLEIEIPYDAYSVGINTVNLTATNTVSTCLINMDNEAELSVEQCKIIVYEGFSPNDDGINETFIIEGLINFPNHKVTIFNRWGNKVYEAAPYLSDWDGTSTLGVTVGGNKLPVGTYFYIIDPGDGSDVIKGYIYLNR